MINKLTGRPVSKEMQQVLNRLNANEDVSLDEIHALPEMREANEYEKSIKPIEMPHELKADLRYGIYTQLCNMGSVRLDDHGREVYNGIVGNDRRLDLVIGLPASGKSSNIVIPLSQQNKARIIDSDMAKELLPGYEKGWGAGYVHQGSKNIIESVLSTALESGDNIVHPIVGSNPEKIFALIQKAEKFGYSINIHYAEIEPNRTLGRMLNRFLETGRYIKPELIYNYGNKVKETYEMLKGECKHEESGKIKSGSAKQFHEILLQRGDGSEGRRNADLQRDAQGAVSGRTGADDRQGEISLFGQKTAGSRLSGLVGYSKWNMDVPKGEIPILHETNCQGRIFEEAKLRQKLQKQAVEEIKKYHFQPTPKMVNAYAAIAAMGSKSVSMESISVLYKSLELVNSDIKDHVKTIGDECKKQEMVKQVSER